jgi:chromosome segregation ATPase
MGESARSIAKKAGGDVVQRTAEALVPRLFERLDRIEEQIAQLRREMHERVGELDRDLHGLREQVDSRFEQTRDGINELGQRIAHVEGRIDVFVSSVNRQSDKMDQWIERLVRVEMTRAPRRGKRAS